MGRILDPAEGILKDGNLDTGERCPREDFIVSDGVLTPDVK